MVLDVVGSSPIGRPTADPAIPVIVLAGGDATRMGGGDKPLRALGGRPILAHILDRLCDAGGPVAISANGDPSRFAAFRCPVLPDATPGLGPLSGILAGLDWAATLGAPDLLSIPGDAPFLPRDLARALLPSPAVAASEGRVHPPVAVWPVACRDELRAHLRDAAAGGRGGRRISGFAARIGMRIVSFETGGGPDPFADLDTPADLARAERTLMAERPG